MKTNKITITLILILLLTPIVLGAENTITPISTQQLTAQQIQDFYIIEETKTRNEFTQYTNQKIIELQTFVQEKGKEYFEENFQIFDQRMHSLAQELLIKFVIGLLAVIILGNAIWYFIQKKIESIGKKPTHLNPDEFAHIVAGIITQEYKEQAQKQKDTKYEKPTYTQKNEDPSPPTVFEIQKMIDDRKFQKQLEKQKREEDKIKKKESKLEKQIQKIEKRIEKNRGNK